MVYAQLLRVPSPGTMPSQRQPTVIEIESTHTMVKLVQSVKIVI